jgi:hypothetical protein
MRTVLIWISAVTCLVLSASSAPDPELNRHIASDNAKPATLLPALIWNPLSLPSGDSLYRTLFQGNYEATLTTDLAPYVDSLSNYHLFVTAGIWSADGVELSWLEFQPFEIAISEFLQGGGSLYWEGLGAYGIISSYSDVLFDYIQALSYGLLSPLPYLRGRGSTLYGPVFANIDSIEYDGPTTNAFESLCGGIEAIALMTPDSSGNLSAVASVICQVDQTRTMLTNFSWARLNDSGLDTRVELAHCVMNWLSGAVAVEEPEPLPQAFSLSPPYPNPFNAQVTLEYALPNEAAVSLSVFDIQGRKVATLTEGTKPAGYHRLIWDAKSMPSGLYFMRLKAGEFTETRKMTLLK